jgi:hypothetical protein
MRKQIFYLSFFLVGVFVSPCMAEDQTITLKDGSQIRGNLVGINGGKYTIHTAALGDVTVNSGHVATITNGAPQHNLPAQGATTAPVNQGNADINQKIQEAQAKLMSNPALMQQVASLAQDPELMQLLSDPELMRAVTSHDVAAIEASPKAKALMNNPKMKALMDQLRGLVSSSP